MLTYDALSMDQNSEIYGLNSNCKIDLNGVVKYSSEKNKVARRRWGLLAKALKSPSGSEPSSPTDEISVRRISSFMLLRTQQLPSLQITGTLDTHLINEINKRTWYKYSLVDLDKDGEEYFVNVGHRNRTFSAEDLMGFNNTGNICIWPSEETLTFYVCTNLGIFHDKTVLEVGGGMSCLAGLFVAKYATPKKVAVTDGNKISVDNVRATLQANHFNATIKCGVLKWNTTVVPEKFDVILCSDCLFFDDARADLIDCIWNFLADKGLALVMAPQRGNTLDRFIAQSTGKGFKCNKILNYSDIVWQKHLALLNNCDYNDNIHYPILIEVTKI